MQDGSLGILEIVFLLQHIGENNVGRAGCLCELN